MNLSSETSFDKCKLQVAGCVIGGEERREALQVIGFVYKKIQGEA